MMTMVVAKHAVKKHRYEKRDSDDKRAGYKKSYRKKKRTSFLKELFDVFD